MAGLKKNIIFYILLFIDFYIIPRFIKDTGSAVIVMLMIIPLICLITSVFYGIRNGFCFLVYFELQQLCLPHLIFVIL